MTSLNKPRRHHYLSQSYQKLFCSEERKKKKTKFSFVAYDIYSKTWRPSQPLNEGLEQDFQKIDHFIGLDPNYFESSFGQIESLAIDVIRKITHAKSIPESLEEFSPAINLMGLFAGRIPFVRDHIISIKKSNSIKELADLHRDEKTYYKEIGNFLVYGNTGWPVFDKYEDSKRFFDGKRFEIRVDTSIVVEDMAKLSVRLTDFFGSLNWMLIEATGLEFITSNKPINPIWAIDFFPYCPLFGDPRSIVTFPLSSNFALIGSSSPLPSYRKVDYLIVDGINWVTANSGATVLYARTQFSLPELESVLHLQDFHRLLSSRLITNLQHI